MGRRVGHRVVRCSICGILVDTKRMDNILEIDEKSLTVLRKWDQWSQLEWALNEKGLTLPHYAASSNCATLADTSPRAARQISAKYAKQKICFCGCKSSSYR